MAQLNRAPGMRAVAVADLEVERAVARATVTPGFAAAEVHVAEKSADAADHVRAGRPVVVPDGTLLADLPLEAVVDSTGLADAGAEVGQRCLRAGQHLVMVNVEADVVVGAALRRIADGAGVVYTLADGDQPSLICSLVDWARSLGLEPLAAGKGSSLFPLDHPTRRAREAGPWHLAHQPGLSGRLQVPDRDGRRANVLGWEVDVRGLRHPSARLEEVATLFGPRERGGLFGRTPVIDFVNCRSEDGQQEIEPHLGHGVFVVVTGPKRRCARWGVRVSLSARTAPRALLWRPFHLVGVETPYSVAQAVLFGAGTAAPRPTPTVEVVAVAKVDLPPDRRLTGWGAAASRARRRWRASAPRSVSCPTAWRTACDCAGRFQQGRRCASTTSRPRGFSFLAPPSGVRAPSALEPLRMGVRGRSPRRRIALNSYLW